MPQVSEEKEYVVLLHGLARSARSMEKLAARLGREGYGVVNIDYPSTRHSIADLTENMLVDKLPALAAKATSIHFVTHSMGGILVRQYLAHHRLPKLGRVVMLSPPNRGSEVVDRLRDSVFFRWLNGPAGQELGTDPMSVPCQLRPVDFDLGVITGNRVIEPWLAWMIPGESDGKVAVESARIEGMRDFLVVPYSHTFIMQRKAVMEQVVCFLRTGKFNARKGTGG
ncbi:MAG TPA: alpha/beta fold hydrolase [Rhodothermales bacterium]|nr:alpha/beta fold hydrolase [Rhodothermales bacterium]